jgi:hypothetical protein
MDRFVEACLVAGSILEIAAFPIRQRGGTLTQVANLEVFEIDRVVLAYEGEGGLVVEVAALALDLLMLLGAPPHRLPPAFATLLATGHTSLGDLQSPLGCTMVAWVVYVVSVRRDKE